MSELSNKYLNEKISNWIGRPCTCEGEYWGSCAMHHLGGLPTPYHTSDRAAVELLSELVQRGYYYDSQSNYDGTHTYVFGEWIDDVMHGHTYKIRHVLTDHNECCPTIAEAICTALLQLIDKEAESI